MTPSKLLRTLFILSTLLRPGAPAAAQNCPPDTLRHSLTKSIPTGADQFGVSVAISTDLTIAGARYDSPLGEDAAGAAYLFSNETGNLLTILTSDDPTDSDYFGTSVALSETLVVVGAYGDDPNGVSQAGRAYVFDAKTGALEATLENPDPHDYDWFAYTLAISGELVVVGALGVDLGGDPKGVTLIGRAYVLHAVTGALVSILENPDPQQGDRFGISVAISGEVAVVGAFYDDPDGVHDAGSAHTFNARTGALLATLADPEPVEDGNLGNSVAIFGNLALAGVPGAHPGGIGQAGKACVFDAATGLLLRVLANPEPATFDSFGTSVAVSGNLAVVGAIWDDSDDILSSGKAHLFDVSTGALLSSLGNPAPAPGDYFGYTVAISGDAVAVGANRDDHPGTLDSGSAYIFGPAPPARPPEIISRLLGSDAALPGLDVNCDGAIDAADLVGAHFE